MQGAGWTSSCRRPNGSAPVPGPARPSSGARSSSTTAKRLRARRRPGWPSAMRCGSGRTDPAAHARPRARAAPAIWRSSSRTPRSWSSTSRPDCWSSRSSERATFPPCRARCSSTCDRGASAGRWSSTASTGTRPGWSCSPRTSGPSICSRGSSSAARRVASTRRSCAGTPARRPARGATTWCGTRRRSSRRGVTAGIRVRRRPSATIACCAASTAPRSSR